MNGRHSQLLYILDNYNFIDLQDLEKWKTSLLSLLSNLDISVVKKALGALSRLSLSATEAAQVMPLLKFPDEEVQMLGCAAVAHLASFRDEVLNIAKSQYDAKDTKMITHFAFIASKLVPISTDLLCRMELFLNADLCLPDQLVLGMCYTLLTNNRHDIARKTLLNLKAKVGCQDAFLASSIRFALSRFPIVSALRDIDENASDAKSLDTVES